MSQTTLPFIFRPSYRREDFLVSGANEEAYAWITHWPDNWPAPALNLYGSVGSGKTHLAHIWQEQSGAGWLDTTRIGQKPTAELLSGHKAWVIEEPTFTGREKDWFHLLNTAREEGIWLLITSREPLSHQNVVLADLASRLGAIPATCLREPDDALLAALLTKRFSDIQLRVSPEVVRYLLSRMERSFASAEKIVERLDHLALMEKKNITLALARKIVETQ